MHTRVYVESAARWSRRSSTGLAHATRHIGVHQLGARMRCGTGMGRIRKAAVERMHAVGPLLSQLGRHGGELIPAMQI